MRSVPIINRFGSSWTCEAIFRGQAIRRPDFVLGASLRCGLYGNDIEAVGGGRRSADCAVLHRRGGAALRVLRQRLLRQLVHPQSRSVRSARCATWATVRHDLPTLRQRLLVQDQWSPGRRCKRLCGKRRELRAGAAAVYLPAAAANPGGLLAAAFAQAAWRRQSRWRQAAGDSHVPPIGTK
jgi:hypothetical protein